MFFFFKQKTAYEIMPSLVGSEMCIRDSSYGQYLYEAARGMDESPLVTHWEPKSFSRETTFQEDVRDWQVIARTLADLSKDVVQDMQGHQYKARTILSLIHI